MYTNIHEHNFYGRRVLPYYNQPHRKYHNASHLEAIFQVAANMNIVLTPEQRMALWFHDAAYIPECGQNEKLSAQLMRMHCTDCKPLIDSLYPNFDQRLVSEMIMDTRDHIPSCAESKVVLDLDMSILGAPEDQYLRYRISVEEEFTLFIPPAMYVPGRIAFLKGLVARGLLFHTEEFVNKFQAQAAKNILKELYDLS